MSHHDLFTSGYLALSNRRTDAGAAGAIYTSAAGGTTAPVFAGQHEYHAAVFLGSVSAAGTLTVFKHTDGAGANAAVHGSVVYTGGTLAVVYEVKSDTLGAVSGTPYTHVSCQFAMASGGSAFGALTILSYRPRSTGGAPATNGIGALGTSLA